MTYFFEKEYDQLLRAAELIKQGQLIAFPTETVFGIGALMESKEAITSLYELKGRSFTKPFTAHLHSMAQIHELVSSPSQLFYDFVEAFVPGPLTIIARKKESVPAFAVGGGEYVGIRIPTHPTAHQLLSLVNAPVMASSANFAKEPPATTAHEVYSLFNTLIAGIIEGEATAKVSSTVIMIDEEDRVHLLREGTIEKTLLEKLSPICYK